MGKISIFFLAIVAVAVAFIASRASETLRFVGDEENPGILDLFRSNSQKKMTNSSSGYIEKVSAFIAGDKTGQDSSMIDDYYNIVTTYVPLSLGPIMAYLCCSDRLYYRLERIKLISNSHMADILRQLDSISPGQWREVGFQLSTHYGSASANTIPIQFIWAHNPFLPPSPPPVFSCGWPLNSIHIVPVLFLSYVSFYEYGWGDQFHFAHLKAGEDHESSLARHEHDLARKMGIKATDKVLDTGSGVGGPARSIHAATGARITGITINEFQIERARYHTKKAGMTEKVDFVQGDFTKMPFEANSYDKIYSIEATCHATDLYDVYSEIARVLKPGGIYGTYEWLTTPLTDKNNQQHVDWLHDIEFGSGLPPMHSLDDALVAAKKAGLELLYEHDCALDTDYEFPWYQKLDMSAVSTTITHYFTLTMETLGLAEPGSTAAHSALLRAIRGLVGGGKSQTFTPMHMLIFKKPEAQKASVKA